MIKNYYKNILLYDFLLKIPIKNIFQLTKINKIYLNIVFKSKILEKKQLINFLIFLKLISNQKIKIIKTKKNNIFLKIKKNSIIGCKVIINKNNIFTFLEKIIIFIIPNLNKNININLKNKNILNLKIKNISNFIEFNKKNFKINNFFTPINISIHTNLKKYENLKIFLNFLFIIN